jgi:monoamine oxidase
MGPQYPTLDKDLNVDVVVIGAGIAGLSIAYNLVKAGKKVAVLEGKSRGKACKSTTVASKGISWLLCFGMRILPGWKLRPENAVGRHFVAFVMGAWIGRDQ